MNFFCPLCRTERVFTVGPRLTFMNYVQILLTTIFLTTLLFPFVQFKGLFAFFIVWGSFEFVRRSLFKKEIPCPHCGFDASWYKRDVKKARELVETFWRDRVPQDSEDAQVQEKAESFMANSNRSEADLAHNDRIQDNYNNIMQ